MSRCFLIALALTYPIAARAQVNGALQPLPFKSGEILSADGKQVVGIQPPKHHAIADSWNLADENITTEITAAYSYQGNIIAFGWAGNYNGIITIIDVNSGKEKLELLVNEASRFITPMGLLIYKHWLVKGAYDPDDSLWMLDLNRPFQPARSGLGEGKLVEEIGVRIYPSATDLKARHRLIQLVASQDGRKVFLIDRPFGPRTTGEVCFVRVDISDVKPADKSKCVDEATLTGVPPDELRMTTLSLDEAGALFYSVTLPGEHGKKEEFTIDTETLSPTIMASKVPESAPESGARALLVPWAVEKKSLIGSSVIDIRNPVFSGHGQDSISVGLIISESGSVRDVSLSGCTGELKPTLESAIRSWSFKPTILDGRHTEVRVQFQATVSELAKPLM